MAQIDDRDDQGLIEQQDIEEFKRTLQAGTSWVLVKLTFETAHDVSWHPSVFGEGEYVPCDGGTRRRVLAVVASPDDAEELDWPELELRGFRFARTPDNEWCAKHQPHGPNVRYLAFIGEEDDGS